jgi:hypothetical protein
MNMTFGSDIPDWKLSRDGSTMPSVLRLPHNPVCGTQASMVLANHFFAHDPKAKANCIMH